MKSLNYVAIMIISVVLVGCSALEHYDRSPAAKEAHKNFMKKRTDGNFYFDFDRVDRNND